MIQYEIRNKKMRNKNIAAGPVQQSVAYFAPSADPSRREVLRWMAMAGAGICLPAGKLLARAGGPAANAPAGRIDVHTHTVPPFYTKIMEKEIRATGHPLPT